VRRRRRREKGRRKEQEQEGGRRSEEEGRGDIGHVITQLFIFSSHPTTDYDYFFILLACRNSLKSITHSTQIQID